MILLLFVIVIVIILAVISTFLSTICSKVGIIVITTVSLKHDGTDRRDSENQVYGHFGTKTLRHRCIVMLVNGGSYVVYGEGSLKQSTFMCRLL